MARVLQNRLWGYIDRSGQWVIPPQWTFAYDFDATGMARVERDNRIGFIDSNGKVVIPLVFQAAEDFDEQGLACICKDHRFGFIDRTGQVIVPLEWSSAYGFAGQPMTRVRNDGGWGVIDRQGRLIVDCQWKLFKELHDHGQTYTLFTKDAPPRPPWLSNLDQWTGRYFHRLLFPTGLKHVYDSQGHLIWSSKWIFASWAPWIMGVAGCVLLLPLAGRGNWFYRRMITARDSRIQRHSEPCGG